MGKTDFDPGENTVNRTSASLYGDAYVAKYNTSGQFQWVNTFGGSSYNRGNDIAVDKRGNVYVTGNFSDITDFDSGAGIANRTTSGGSDAFLVNYDTDGNFKWVNTFGGNTNHDDGISVAVDPANNIYVTGRFADIADFDPSANTAERTSIVGSDDIFLVKYTAQGNFLWVNAVGGSEFDFPLGVATDGNGNPFVTGYFKGTVDFDPSANSASRTSYGAEDIFLAKYNAQGGFLWVNQIGGPVTANPISSGYDVATALLVDAAGNAYIGGRFTSTVDFDPSGNTSTLTSVNVVPATGGFVAKYTTDGNYGWAIPLGENGAGNIADLAQGINGQLVVGGTMNFAGDIDPSASTSNVTGGFVASYTAQIPAITVTNITTTSPPPMGSPFNAGTGVSVDYTITNYTAVSPNVFTAQLSDAMGSFASPIDIGNVTSLVGGTITALLPANLSPGTHYRIRVVASNPNTVGRDNGSDLTINSPLSLSASNLTINGTLTLGAANCPARLTGLGWGKAFVFTGPGGYAFSNAFRNFILGGTIEARDIRLPGIYTLTVYGNPDQTPVTYSITITGQGCP